MIKPDKVSEELRAAITRIVTLTTDDVWSIRDNLELKSNQDPPYTIPNALTILQFLGTPVEENELRKSKILSEGQLPEPHATLFFALATRQDGLVMNMMKAIRDANDRDRFLEELKP
jgi:hypothetical protein